MGLPFPVRILSLPHPPTRPSTQLLTLLLPDIPDIPHRLFFYFTNSTTRTSIPPITVNQFCAADDIITGDGTAFWKTERGSGLYMVRANSGVRAVQ
jgi:hypothetical protein